jgi:hypothetical protein
MAHKPDVFTWSTVQLQRHIRQVAKDSERVVFLNHVMERMVQRKISDTEVRECLQRGVLHGTPEPNAAKGNLECDMRNFCAGRNIRVIVAVSNDDPDLILVTVMTIKK